MENENVNNIVLAYRKYNSVTTYSGLSRCSCSCIPPRKQNMYSVFQYSIRRQVPIVVVIHLVPRASHDYLLAERSPALICWYTDSRVARQAYLAEYMSRQIHQETSMVPSAPISQTLSSSALTDAADPFDVTASFFGLRSGKTVQQSFSAQISNGKKNRR